MLKVYNNVLLLDFIKMAIAMPADERAQMEAASGEPYTIDGAALGNATAPGPKWVIKDEDEPIIIGGFVPKRAGVWQDFLLTTPVAFEKHWFPVTRICRRIMDSMYRSGAAHRIECIVPASRLAARPELERWYKVMGYNKEGLRYGYYANGSDAVAFARVKH